MQQTSHIPVSQDPNSKVLAPVKSKTQLISTFLLLLIAITFVGIYGGLRTDIGYSSNNYPQKYVSFVETSLAGTIIGMIALLLAVIDYYYHNKIFVFIVMAGISIAWVLVFAGMILGAEYYVDPLKGLFVGLWFIYSFMVFHVFMNLYQSLQW